MIVPPRRTRRFPALAAALALTGAIGGCGEPRRTQPVREALEAPALAPASEPIVAASRHGLEVHWWIADDTDGVVGEALRAFAEPALPLSPELRERWRVNGLRMVRLTVEQFDALQRTLPPLHARRRLWVGWVTQWQEIFRGRRAGGPAGLLVDGQRRSLPAGALRLIARAWPAPGLAEEGHRAGAIAPQARLELALQLQAERPRSATDVFEQPSLLPAEQEGTVFHPLTLETALEDGFVYLITSEDPQIEWSAGAAPAREPPPPGAEEIPLLDVSPEDVFGPPASGALTLGEAMLSATYEETGARDFRVLIALLPRCPDRYRLLP